MAVLSNTGIRAGASGAGGAYKVEKSLRFNDDDTAYLNRTPGSAGNRKTWTYSAWVKRGALVGGAAYNILSCMKTSNTDFVDIRFNSDDLRMDITATGQTRVQINTTALFRDPTAWYHIVIAVDTTESSSSDRFKLYVNNVQQTTTNTLVQDIDTAINSDGVHNIGRRVDGSDQYFDGYMAEVHLIDGSALDPSSFGETDEDTGQWVPIKYAGSYGTNGFFLKFDGTDLGEDSAGSNDWTAEHLEIPSNLDVPCVKFDGTDDDLDVDNSTDFDFGSGDFTLECFVNPTTPSSTIYQTLMGTGSSVGYWWTLQSKADGTSGIVWYSFHASGNLENKTSASFAITNGDWNHVAMARDGDNLRIFINGALSTTVTGVNAKGAMTASSNDFRIGMDIDGLNDMNGAISNVRVVKGQCLYTSAFTVPSRPLTTTSQSATESNVKLLCCQSSSTATEDNSTSDHTITPGGNATAGTLSGNQAGVDVSPDSPSTFDDELNGTGNYCTLNPLGSDGTLSQGNLTHDPGAGSFFATSTIGFSSGKWYGEFTLDTHAYPGIGVCYEAKPGVGWMATQAPYYFIYDNGSVLNNYPGGSEHFSSLPSTTFATGVWQIALDVDNGKCWIGYQDTWYSDQWATTGNPATGANPTFTLPSSKTWYFFLYSNGAKWTANFGQRTFKETKPSGFLAPNSYNLGDTAALSGSYTGNGSVNGPAVFINTTPATLKLGTSNPATAVVSFDAAVVDPTAGGFKIRHASTNNGSGTTYYWLATTNRAFKYANAQTNS